MTSPVTRIVLVGLPGAGKSTVGALAAERLGWAFADLDVEIERVAGRTVAEIFAEEGEAGFRARERDATRALRGREQVVVASGGGWALDPLNREMLGRETALVHLRVSPSVAARRLAEAPDTRPLLDPAEPEKSLRQLLDTREAAYLQANHTITVDSMTPIEVASLIVALATGRGAD